MSSAELINLMRQALVFLHRCIPEAERILRFSERENGGATSLVRCQKNFLRSTCTAGLLEIPARIRKQTHLAIGLLRGRLGVPQVRAKSTLPESFDRFASVMGRNTTPFLLLFLSGELNHISGLSMGMRILLRTSDQTDEPSGTLKCCTRVLPLSVAHPFSAMVCL